MSENVPACWFKGLIVFNTNRFDKFKQFKKKKKKISVYTKALLRRDPGACILRCVSIGSYSNPFIDGLVSEMGFSF